MTGKQEFTYYTSILHSGNGPKGILLQAEVGNVTLSTRKIIAEISLVHDHHGITPKDWRKQLYTIAKLSPPKR